STERVALLRFAPAEGVVAWEPACPGSPFGAAVFENMEDLSEIVSRAIRRNCAARVKGQRPLHPRIAGFLPKVTDCDKAKRREAPQSCRKPRRTGGIGRLPAAAFGASRAGRSWAGC